MSGVEGGWQAYPGASDGEAAFRLAPVEPGRVVGLGAICDLLPLRADPSSQDFKVSEFVDLEDGRRVLLHDGGRGLMTSGVRTTSGWRAPDVRWGLTLEGLTSDVLTVVLPDDETTPNPTPGRGLPTWRALAVST